jgi:DNA replication protein DnaC
VYGGGFLRQARNLILIGGTGTGKTHLAIAIASYCVKLGHRARFFSVVDLVNQLEREKELGKAGALASRLVRVEWGASEVYGQ